MLNPEMHFLLMKPSAKSDAPLFSAKKDSCQRRCSQTVIERCRRALEPPAPPRGPSVAVYMKRFLPNFMVKIKRNGKLQVSKYLLCRFLWL
jgi:hypothetical protein